MPIQLSPLALADGDLASVFQSPMIVPVAFALMILGIVVAGIWANVRTREMRSQERLAAIAKGVPLEPTWDEQLLHSATGSPAMGAPRRLNDGAGARRTGLVLFTLGLGLCAFFVALAAIVRVREVLSGAAAGLIPLAIGVGFLVDGRLRRAEYNRAMEAESLSASGSASVASTRSGDLRPLH